MLHFSVANGHLVWNYTLKEDYQQKECFLPNVPSESSY